MGKVMSKGERILIVDDDADEIEARAELLRSNGYEVFSAETGDAADEVAGRLLYQDQADDIGPNQVAGAKHVAEQARRQQLDGQAGHAGGEDGQFEESIRSKHGRHYNRRGSHGLLQWREASRV